VYVTDTNNDRVQEFTNNGTFITKWGGEGTGDFEELEDIELD
jgi:tripartite motif-containing protein 71